MSISSEVAIQRTGPTQMIQQYQSEFAKALPSFIEGDAARWVRLAESAVKKSPQLLQIAKQDQGVSLMRALLKCAQLGHEPGSGYFHLVPKGGSIEGWEDYKGIIQRVLRTGLYRRVIAEVVFENDEFSYDPNQDEFPHHKFSHADTNRGKPKMAYAYAVHHDGTPTFISVATPEKIAASKAKAMGASGASSPWNNPAGPMYIKVAVRQLEKMVRTSSDERRETIHADSVRADLIPTDDVYDDESVILAEADAAASADVQDAVVVEEAQNA